MILLTNHSHNPELPPRLAQDLRALGGVQAPEELWGRVQLGLALGEVEQAPEELWARVQPEVAEVAATLPGPHAGRVLRHNDVWGRRLTVAAALMILAGFGYRFMGPAPIEPGAALSGHVSSTERAAFRAKVVFMEVSAAELSSVANEFAQSFGGLTMEDQS